MKKSDKFNGSGCLDMTAFMALKNIERERAKKSGHIRKPIKKNSVSCKIQIFKSRVDSEHHVLDQAVNLFLWV